MCGGCMEYGYEDLYAIPVGLVPRRSAEEPNVLSSSAQETPAKTTVLISSTPDLQYLGKNEQLLSSS